MSQDMCKTVIVIGAGLAGLTAAHRLAQRGFQVQVLEGQDQPGGRMGQRQSGPIAYNTGARLIYPFGRDLHRLVDELGLRGDMLPLKGLGATCVDTAQRHAIQLMPDAAVLRTPGLSLRTRWRLPLELRELIAAMYHLGGGVYSREALVMNLAAQVANLESEEGIAEVAGGKTARLLRVGMSQLSQLIDKP